MGFEGINKYIGCCCVFVSGGKFVFLAGSLGTLIVIISESPGNSGILLFCFGSFDVYYVLCIHVESI